MRAQWIVAGLLLCGCTAGIVSGPPDGGSTADGGGSDGGDAGLTDGGGTTPDAGGPFSWNPTNILNNGGFEYGLMCYGNWVWSTTGVDYKGDYDFLLSTDAHGGNYSLEIRCTGADCLKAAIYSQRIHSPRSQAYKLSLYSKCPAGKRAYFYTPSAAAGDLSQDLSCTGAWAANEVTLTSSATADELLLYVYNASDASLLIDDQVLTYGDGSVLPQTVRHPGVRNVGTAGQAVTVDGAPYLALGFFDVPYADLQAVADAGANTVTGLGLDELADCFNTDRDKYLDRAFELGVGVVPDSTTTARLDVPAVYPAVMDRFAPHLGNLAWYLVDEPDQAAVSWYYIAPATLVSEHDQARTRTSLPMVVDFQRASWDLTSVVQPYGPAADVFMAEPYGDDFSGVTHAMNLFKAIAARPTWLAQDPASANLIVPKAWFAITEGATGVLYFTWGDFQAAPAKLDAAKQAFTELQSLRAALFDTNLDAQVSGPTGVHFVARQHQGKKYVVAVNPTAATVSGDFTVAGLTAGQQVTVLFEGRTLTAASGKFTDSFNGIARHVYELQ